MSEAGVREDAFPASGKQATGLVGGLPTEISSMNFSDKIVMTLSQEGRLPQWIQVPLSSPSSALPDLGLPSSGLSTLPSTHLTPKTLLGGGGEQRETLGQLLASQIANLLVLRNPEDTRTLLLGLGLVSADMSREAFFDIIELIQQMV